MNMPTVSVTCTVDTDVEQFTTGPVPYDPTTKGVPANIVGLHLPDVDDGTHPVWIRVYPDVDDGVPVGIVHLLILATVTVHDETVTAVEVTEFNAYDDDAERDPDPNPDTWATRAQAYITAIQDGTDASVAYRLVRTGT